MSTCAKTISLQALHKTFRQRQRPQKLQQQQQRFLSSSWSSSRYHNGSTTAPFSTNAALLEDDTDYSSSSSTTTTAAAAERTTLSRPRLESLRQQLRNDKNGKSSLQIPSTASVGGASASKKVHVTNNSNSNNKKKSSTNSCSSSSASSPSPSSSDMELQDLLKHLETLPLPEKTQDTLTDTFGRHHSYLRISLSEKCNLRCLYCMPEDGVPVQPQSNLLSNDEILKLTSWFVKEGGVTKLRLTGGEPLLRKDLTSLVYNMSSSLASPQYLQQIGMTTNGVTLSKHIHDLVDAGLTHVNISLDSLDADKFAKLTRRPPSYHAKVLQAIEDCATLLPYQTKINCVVMPENVNELASFCELTRHMPIDVRFIEYMPFNDNQWQTNGFVSYQDMQTQIQQQLGGGEGHSLQRLEDGPNDTTKWWRLPTTTSTTTTMDNYLSSSSSSQSSLPMGRIGFITSMSNHFCSSCNRLRITADGKLKVCLFGKTEVSLRDLLRMDNNNNNNITTSMSSDEALQKLIYYSVQRKHFKLGGHKDMQDLQAHSTENRPMTLIGG